MRKQKLIIVNGLPASGKTTLAQYLAKELHLPMFNKDSIKELLSDRLALTSTRSSRRFDDPSFSLLLFISKTLLANGFSVIIEGNFQPGGDIVEFGKQVNEAGITIVEVFCTAKGDVLIERFVSRMELRHPIHPRIMPVRFVRTLRAGRLASLSIGEVITVDTSDFMKIPYKKIIRFIKK